MLNLRKRPTLKSLLCAEELRTVLVLGSIYNGSDTKGTSLEHNLIAKPGRLAHLLTIHGNCPACLHNVVVLQAC